MRSVAPLLLLSASACAIAAPREPAAPVGESGSCEVSGLGALAGRSASQELGAEALRRSGARTLRWIRPGDMVTMDFRADRLNIHLDAAHRAERFACG